MKTPIRVGIIFGGKSREHDVSVWSAKCVLKEIDRNQYHPIPIYIDKEGNWHIQSEKIEFLVQQDPELRWILNNCLQESLSIGPQMKSLIDVVFPILHGPNGEDGMIQGILQSWQVPYVGCNLLSSAIAMDKLMTKSLFQWHRLPCLHYVEIRKHDWQHHPDEEIERLRTRLDYPLFIKPANMGSSIGISKVKDIHQLKDAIVLAFRYDQKLIIEQGLNDCREFELAVLGNEYPKLSKIGEIEPANEFYDYASKYEGLHSNLIIPAHLSHDLEQQIHQFALAAYWVLNCRGFARVDFLFDNQTQVLYLNEVNTIPGFTSISMYPMLWEASGVAYSDLIDSLISLAIASCQDDVDSTTS